VYAGGMRFAACGFITVCLLSAQNSPDPFATAGRARVFLFVRSDCPITNRYAPELQRIAKEFAGREVEFWMVYADSSEAPEAIESHMSQYHFPGKPLRDPRHQLVKRAQATVAPEAAVFDAHGSLVYHGRIDDLWISPGKSRSVARTHELHDVIAAVLAGKPSPYREAPAIGCSLADVQ
jgi:hypothetical protein